MFFKLIIHIIYNTFLAVTTQYHALSLPLLSLPVRVCQQSEVFELRSVLGGRSWTGAQVTELIITFP